MVNVTIVKTKDDNTMKNVRVRFEKRLYTTVANKKWIHGQFDHYLTRSIK